MTVLIIRPILKKYIDILKDFFEERLLSVAVFGSIARGTARFPQSDIDVLIVVQGIEKLSFGDRIKLMIECEERLSKTEEYTGFKHTFGTRPNIQEIIFSPSELKAHPPILLDMTTDMITLYDKGILNEEIDKLRKRLKLLGAKKVERDGSWFWILKPDVKLGENVEI